MTKWSLKEGESTPDVELVRGPLRGKRSANRMGRCIVFLHPIGVSHAFWWPLLRALPADQPWVALDLPGHGDTPSVKALDLDAMAGETEEALNSLDLLRPVLCGLSLGGMVAVQVALRGRVELGGLVVADARLDSSKASISAWDERIAFAEARGMGAVGEAFVERWIGASSCDDELRVEIARLLAAGRKSSFVEAARIVQHVDLADRVRDISCRTLFVTGDRDAGAPVSHILEMSGRSDAYMAVLPDAGHISLVQQPASGARLLCWFVERVSAKASHGHE